MELNMFDSNHYIPILKWKRAEQKALAELKTDSKPCMTPLIQLVMPKSKVIKADGKVVKKSPEEEFEEVLSRFKENTSTIAETIVASWGKEAIFIDFSLLYTNTLKVESSEVILRKSKELGAKFIPVLNISDEEKLKKVICSFANESGNGLCLRLVCSDIVDAKKLTEEIKYFIELSGLAPKNIDLLVDIQDICGNTDKYQLYSSLSQKTPHLLEWRTFTFASGAFPVDLTGYKIDEENLIPRLDWQNWKGQFDEKKLLRVPSFADYTIQHPIYKESSQFFAPTTSIKYTVENEWVLAKGKKQKFELYLFNAKALVDDDCFLGEHFSQGDKYISEKAKHFEEWQKNPAIKKETGNSELWIKAGINHHLEYVVFQISNLS